MKMNWDKKYTTIAVYAFLVIAASILFYLAVSNFSGLLGVLGRLIGLIMPIIIGLCVAYILNPVLKVLENQVFCHIRPLKKRKKALRGVSLLVTFVIAIACAYLIIMMIIPQIMDSVAGLTASLPGYFTSAQAYITQLFRDYPFISDLTGITPENLADTLMGWVGDLSPFVSNIINGFIGGVMGAVTGVTNVIVGLIVSIYLLYGKENFFAQTKKITFALFPKSYAQRLQNVYHNANTIFNGYIIGKILDSIIVGVLCYLVMSIVRFPYPLLNSVIIGVTNVIPFFGPIIGAIPTALLVFLARPEMTIWFLLFVLILQQLDGNVIGPLILGDSTGLPAFWVVFAILVGGGLAGFMGMVIGVPIFAVIYSLVRTWIEGRLNRKGLPASTGEYQTAPEEAPRPRRGKLGKLRQKMIELHDKDSKTQ